MWLSVHLNDSSPLQSLTFSTCISCSLQCDILDNSLTLRLNQQQTAAPAVAKRDMSTDLKLIRLETVYV